MMQRSFSLPAFLLGMALVVTAAADLGGQQQEKPLAPLSAGDWDARRAAHLLDRAGFGGSPEQIEFLVSLGAIEALAGLLARSDERVLLVALAGIDNILATGKSRAAEEGVSNPYAERLKEGEGLAAVEGLQVSHNGEISKKAVDIIKFFSVEAEGDEEVAPAEEGD